MRRGKALLCPVDIRSKTGNEELLTVSARRWRITVGPDVDGQVAITALVQEKAQHASLHVGQQRLRLSGHFASLFHLATLSGTGSVHGDCPAAFR